MPSPNTASVAALLPLLLALSFGCSKDEDTCAPGGVLHGSGAGAHCDCDRGYRADGLRCVAQEATPDMASAPDLSPADAMPVDTDGCGPHGEAHEDHCHCDAGYYEEKGTMMCVALPACKAANDALEPNDTPAQAKAWEERHAAEALRVCPDDYDFFKVDLTAGQAVTIDLTFQHGEGDLDLLLWEPGKNPYREEPVATSESKDDDEQVRHTAAVAGQYLFIVLGAHPTAQAPYRLRVTR